MVARASVQHLRVDVPRKPMRKTFEEIVNQIALQIADALDVQREVYDRVGSPAGSTAATARSHPIGMMK